DHAADTVGIVAREHAVHDDLRDRDLAAHGLAARLEIDRVGEALLGLGARLALEAEALGRTLRMMAFARHLALACDRLAARLPRPAPPGEQAAPAASLSPGWSRMASSPGAHGCMAPSMPPMGSMPK